MQNEETDEIPFVVVVDISLASSSRTTERVPTKAQFQQETTVQSPLLQTPYRKPMIITLEGLKIFESMWHCRHDRRLDSSIGLEKLESILAR